MPDEQDPLRKTCGDILERVLDLKKNSGENIGGEGDELRSVYKRFGSLMFSAFYDANRQKADEISSGIGDQLGEIVKVVNAIPK